MTPVPPEREIVAIRKDDGPHQHIIRVKLADGTEQDTREVIAAIKRHDAHYIMRKDGLPLPLLVRAQQCPDCLEEVLWA